MEMASQEETKRSEAKDKRLQTLATVGISAFDFTITGASNGHGNGAWIGQDHSIETGVLVEKDHIRSTHQSTTQEGLSFGRCRGRT